MNWMSKHATEHKKNLLNEMPIDNHGSVLNNNDPEKKAIKKAKKYLKSVENDPRKKEKLDSINKEYLNQFNKFDLGRDPGKNFDVNHYISKMSGRDVPFGMKGPLDKGCAKSEGGPGCVQKRGDEYVIINNKKPGSQVWRGGFASKAEANKVLSGYHANK